MTRPAKWPKGTEVQKTNLGIPRRTWEASKIQAMRENRTLQELVAEALEDYMRKVKKGGDRR
jgi:hypothetical protein